MISDRRPQWRGPRWVVCLILALVAVLPAAPAFATPVSDRAPAVASAATVPTRIEGFLRLSDGNWFVENTRVLIGPHTALDERRGRMAPDAWVAVWGDMTAETITATVLHVLRPAGAAAPTVQFVGVLTKFAVESGVAIISNTEVYFDANTYIPLTPPRYSQVRITGQRRGNGILAQSIEVLATDANTIPVNIEGAVEQVTDTLIAVDGQTVLLRPQDAGGIHQGDWVQVRALAAQDGTLVAETIQVVDRSRAARLDAYVTAIDGMGEDNQTWSVVTFESGRPQTRRVLVADETYVGEDRASMQAEIEAFIDGSKVNAVDVKAEMIWLDQPGPEEMVGKLTSGVGDGLWSMGGQPVYFPSEELSSRARAIRVSSAGAQDAVVVTGVKLSNGVLVAKAVRAATAADLSGAEALALRAATAASTDWVGPLSVVSQVNPSGPPTLLLSADRAAHLVYESDGNIYYVTRADGKAWGAPRKLAKGLAPTAIFDAFGNLHVAYVNTFLGNSDIFHLMLKRGGAWTNPTQVSSTSGGSNAPALAADDKGGVFVTWADHTSGAWMIHAGRYDGAYWINYPVPNASGGSPSITTLPDGSLFLAWQDRVPTAQDAFGALNIYGSEQTAQGWYLPVNISDNARYSPGAESKAPSLVAAADGNAHLAWVDDNQQPRYDFGRGLYWPAPVDLGPRQASANGLTLRLGVANTLYVTWDGPASPLFTSAAIGAQAWPTAEPLPGATGAAYGASLALAGRGMAVVWLQDDSQSSKTFYEARSGLASPLLKNWLPLITR